MTGFGRALSAEIVHLRRDRWDLFAVAGLPGLLLAVIAAMLIHAVPRQLPVAVVDEDRSAFSRAILRDVAASPTVRIVAHDDTMVAAFHRMRSEAVWAVLRLPRGIGHGGAFHRPPPAVQIFYQASFLSMGSVVSRAIETAVSAAVAGEAPNLLASHGLPAVRLSPPVAQVTILQNPATSFEWYLGVLIYPAVLHLAVACMTVVALGREAVDGSFARWAAASGGAGGALAGKILPYVAITCFWGVVWLVWLTLLRSWPVRGSVMLLVLGQAVLFAGTAGISAVLVAVTRSIGTGLSASAIYAGSALAYSGATLPLDGASRLATVWSAGLPLTHYLRMQMDQYVGAPPQLALVQLAVPAAYAAGGWAVATLILRRAAATPR